MDVLQALGGPCKMGRSGAFLSILRNWFQGRLAGPQGTVQDGEVWSLLVHFEEIGAFRSIQGKSKESPCPCSKINGRLAGLRGAFGKMGQGGEVCSLSVHVSTLDVLLAFPKS